MNAGKRRTRTAPNPPLVVPLGAEAAETPTEMDTTEGPKNPNPVPAPPKFTLSAQAFFDYWSTIPENVRRERIMVYAYRVIPILDVLQPYSQAEIEEFRKKKKQMPQTNIGKFVDPIDPKAWVEFCLETWGAGDYHFKLNDQHPSVKTTLCMCNTQVSDDSRFREWDSYPPVLRLDEVVLKEENNKSYIRWAHLKGIRFPGEPGVESGPTEQENKDDMANVESVSKLTDAVIKLADRPQQQQQQAPPRDVNAEANLKGAEIVAEASKLAIQSMADTMKQAQEAAIKTQDPNEYFRNVTEAAKMMMPPPPPPQPAAAPVQTGPTFMDAVTMFQTIMTNQSAQHQSMITLLQEQHRSSMTQLADRLANAEKAQQDATNRLLTLMQTPPTPAPPPSSGTSALKDTIDIIKAFGGLQTTIANLGTQESTPTTWVDLAAELLPKFLDTAQGIATAVTRPAVPPTAMNPQGQPQTPSAATPAVQSQPETEKDMMARFARQLKDPVLYALRQGLPGSRFGGWFIVNYGRQYYDMAVQNGQQGVYAFFQSDGGVWGELIATGTPRLEQFLNEFLDVSASLAQADLIRSEQERSAPAVPQSMPVPGAAARPQQQQPRPTVVEATPSNPATPDPTPGRKIRTADGKEITGVRPNGSTEAV